MQASEVKTDTEAHHSPDPSPVPDPQKPTDSDDDAPQEDDGATLSRDEIFGILSNPRRRATIHYLNDHEDELVQLRDIAEQLAAWENDVAVEAVTYKQRKRVYTSLYQSHLPKMDDMGIVHFDKHRGTVEGSAWTRQLENYLDELEDDNDGWPLATAGAATLCGGLAVGAWIGPLSVGIGTPVGLALGVAITVLAVSLTRGPLAR